MPAETEKQRRAAAIELERRKKGAKKSKSRPFGTTSISDLKDFAGSTAMTKGMKRKHE